MRAAPAFQVSVSRFGWWCGVHVAAALLTAAVCGAWCLSRPERVGLPGALAATAAVGVWLAWALRALRRRVPLVLRWDTQRWHLFHEGPSAEGVVTGELRVALDLGPWMLLAFVPEALPRRAATVWLGVQRRGLEASWHGLRCAVYGARPRADAALPQAMP